jgi:hypothetical protein
LIRGELTTNLSPEASDFLESDVLQPFKFVNVFVSTATTVFVALSRTDRDMDLKSIPPVFFSLISTHQPTHESKPAYDASNPGTGVGVGGGVKIGNAWVFPTRVAYSPHNQQNPLLESGLRTYQ